MDNIEQLRAAYALNLCSVSVSQIVDYNDIYILEQEYDAILNNLNLERMPKDEPLLNVITEMLNTITFFRIQELKKKQIEKKYQRRVKDAIWSAMPNPGAIIASVVRNPIGVAATVGTGYMNYRREKANIALEQEKEEFELKITAMEQFNALQRELFTTSWRLADKYCFPDKYRLTEKQIKQYNEILMDNDSIRKYERLISIKSSFEAYPVYWYFLGQAANEVSRDNRVIEDDTLETYEYYLKEAKKYYETYIQFYKEICVLRQDQIAAACALEYLELLDPETEKEKIIELLGIAVDNSKNVNDIKQICAFDYLKMGDKDNILRAVELFKELINEDYNRVLNLQFISCVYAKFYLDSKEIGVARQYHVIENRFEADKQYLFPLPNSFNGTQYAELNSKFIRRQITIIKKKYTLVLQEFFKKYRIIYNKVLPTEKDTEEYNNNYFLDDDKSRGVRERDISNMLQTSKKEDYIAKLKLRDIRIKYLEIFNNMFLELQSLEAIYGESLDKLKTEMAKSISVNGKRIKPIMDKLKNSDFEDDDYKKLHEVRFWDFIEPVSHKLNQILKAYLDSIEGLDEISKVEQNLAEFCDKLNIEDPEVLYTNRNEYVCSSQEEQMFFDFNLWEDGNLEETFSNYERSKAMREIVLKYEKNIVTSDKEVKLCLTEKDCKNYFQQIYLGVIRDEDKSNTICIIDDIGMHDYDLIFTINGIIPVRKGRVKQITKYKNVYFDRSDIIISDFTYSYKDIDMDELYKMIKELSDVAYTKVH